MQLPPLRRPNVLWIFGDQHRAQATGYRGSQRSHVGRTLPLCRT